MGEREPRKENIGKGELYFLHHPGTDVVFSGYGLTFKEERKDILVGLLMVDRPNQVDQEWLQKVEDTFGEYQLVPMTTTGERGIICRMQIEPESTKHLQKHTSDKSELLKLALEPLIDTPPIPNFLLHWNEKVRAWQSQIIHPNELPEEIKNVFEKTGYGCMAVESDIGVVHVCHASDDDIESFVNKPVVSRWELIKMPTAPLIRLELIILDRPDNPFMFESFLNIAEENQANLLVNLANQDRLYLAFYGDDLDYRYTKVIPHDRQQWQQIYELTTEAKKYLAELSPDQQDYDLAKVEFIDASGVA